MDFDRICEASQGRCGEIIGALTVLPPDVVEKRGKDHPCPLCNGKTVIWTPDGNGQNHGRLACRNCTSDRPTGDVIATVAQWRNQKPIAKPLEEAALAIADYLGLAYRNMPSVPIASGSLTERVCRAKKIPVGAFLKFGTREVTRNGKPVVRVDAYDCFGNVHSHFDMTEYGKGLNAPGEGSSGMFFPGRLPQRGETWCIVEGVKDAAALESLGYHACGTPGNHLPAKHARLFEGVNVVLVPDLDKIGFVDGKDKSGRNLFGIANTIKVARLPGPIQDKNGMDVRDLLCRPDGEKRFRRAFEEASDWSFPEADVNVTECTEFTESAEYNSITSVTSVDSVYSVTLEQKADLENAIAKTAPLGASKKNSGIFKFCRKLKGIFGDSLTNELVRQHCKAWFEVALRYDPELELCQVLAEAFQAIKTISTPDTGDDVLTRARNACDGQPAPSWFEGKDNSKRALLAKLIVELDRIVEGEKFYLSCSSAAELTGLSRHDANKLLNYWVAVGILELVEKGVPGPPGSKASRYRLMKNCDSANNGPATEQPSASVANTDVRDEPPDVLSNAALDASEADEDLPTWVTEHEIDDEFDEVDPSEVPICECGRDCDIESLDGEWRCSRCDSDIGSRFNNTFHWMDERKRLSSSPRPEIPLSSFAYAKREEVLIE